jgi:hypothetical protein
MQRFLGFSFFICPSSPVLGAKGRGKAIRPGERFQGLLTGGFNAGWN